MLSNVIQCYPMLSNVIYGSYVMLSLDIDDSYRHILLIDMKIEAEYIIQ